MSAMSIYLNMALELNIKLAKHITKFEERERFDLNYQNRLNQSITSKLMILQGLNHIDTRDLTPKILMENGTKDISEIFLIPFPQYGVSISSMFPIFPH